MMTSYDSSPYAAFFFLIFNILGIYFLMALFLAVVYNRYSEHVEEIVRLWIAQRESAAGLAVNSLLYSPPRTSI